MPEQNYAQLYRSLSSKDAAASGLARVYLITGSDDVLKHELIDRLKSLALDPEFADFDYSAIDMGPGSSESDDSSDQVLKILSASAAAPFMSARRVVLVTSIQRLAAERQSALGQGLANLGALTLLILVADAQEVEAGRAKGKSVETSLKRAAATHGVVVACDSPQAADLKARAQHIFEGWGLKADSPVCQTLSEYASTMSANAGSGAVAILTRECEKLRSYVGERNVVTMNDIDALLPTVTQENIFRLLDCVGNRSTKDALAQLDAILLAGDKPDGIAARTFVMLQRHMRMLILGKHVSEGRGGGRSGADRGDIFTSEMMSTLNGQSYRLQSYSRQASNFTWDELIHASSRILASDMSMKGMSVDKSIGAQAAVMSDQPAANLKLLITELCMKA